MSEEDFAFTMVPFSSHGFFWVTFTGRISIGRLGRAHDEFTSHPSYDPSTDELLDFSATSIGDMSRSDIELIRRFMVDKPDRHNNKSVIVVSSRFEYGLGRMMGALLDQDVPVDRWVCYSVREALEWLRPGEADRLIAAHAKAVISQP